MLTQSLLAVALACAPCPAPPQPFADFASRVQAYMAVRLGVQEQLWPTARADDRAKAIRDSDALAHAIVRARASARPGDIFSIEITAAFRSAIAAGCSHRFDELRGAIDTNPGGAALPAPALHGRWPAGAPLPPMPPGVLAALPRLPDGLEYRFMSGALVLRDVDANLVVDYLPDAIPQPTVLLPARLLSASTPAIPPDMVSGGEVLFEVTVDSEGHVAGVRALRSTPPMTAVVAAELRNWRFRPAERRIDADTYTLHFSVTSTRMSTVLVAAVFRPPSIAAPTLGAWSADVATAGEETPFPLRLVPPRFPLRAFAPGVVLVEVSVDCEGQVGDARVIESAPPFDAEALDAVRQWRFRPARIAGKPVPALAYVLFGFPLPTTP